MSNDLTCKYCGSPDTRHTNDSDNDLGHWNCENCGREDVA